MIPNVLQIVDVDEDYGMPCYSQCLRSKVLFKMPAKAESMHDDGSLVFAYYKEGATDPTFLYFAYGLKEVKC